MPNNEKDGSSAVSVISETPKKTNRWNGSRRAQGNPAVKAAPQAEATVAAPKPDGAKNNTQPAGTHSGSRNRRRGRNGAAQGSQNAVQNPGNQASGSQNAASQNGAQNGAQNTGNQKSATAAPRQNSDAARNAGAPRRRRSGGNRPETSLISSLGLTPSAGIRPSAASENGVEIMTRETNLATEPEAQEHQKSGGAKLRVMMLGGMNEIGKNMAVLEYGNDIIIVDCGLAFPDEDMPGIDLVIPDITYLEKNQDKIRGMLITHGHEDHIGAIPYVLRTINPPIFGTRLTLGIIQKKLEEHVLPNKPQLNCVEAGDTVKLGTAFQAEFIHVNHSIADACCLAIKTPVGMVVHSGDFKLDISPIDGQMMDLTRLGEIGQKGVLLLMCESTNAERPGFTPSEKKVGQSLENIFMRHKDMRIVIATFSSNVHRVQQIIDTSVRYGRKVVVTGRSMTNIVKAALELGYMKVPEGILIDITEIKKYNPEQLTLVCTGSQGEPMSALYRMAFSEHDKITLTPRDLVILSASAIPGNEKLVGKVINALMSNGVKVLSDAVADVHVSGHACQEELKLMHALVKPKYFMPIHGEYKHLAAHKELAMFMGMPESNIFITDVGKVLEIDRHGARFNGTVPSGRILVDGYGVGDVGNIVLRDRKHLSEDGLLVVVATVNREDGTIISGPDIISRGFVYMRESEELINHLQVIAYDAMQGCLDHGVTDWQQIKGKVKDDLAKYLYTKTKRSPMILPIVMNV